MPTKESGPWVFRISTITAKAPEPESGRSSAIGSASAGKPSREVSGSSAADQHVERAGGAEHRDRHQDHHQEGHDAHRDLEPLARALDQRFVDAHAARHADQQQPDHEAGGGTASQASRASCSGGGVAERHRDVAHERRASSASDPGR